MGSSHLTIEALAEKLGSVDTVADMLTHIPVGVLWVDERHVVQYANERACKIVGIEYPKLVGKTCSDLFGEHYPKMLRERFPHEVTLHPDNVGPRVVEVGLVGTESGHHFCYLTDISIRKELEIELQRRDTFFHDLIESSVDGIIAADMKGRIITFNGGAVDILGYSKEDAYGSLHVKRLYPEGEAQDILKRMRSDEFGGKGRLLRHQLIAITKEGNQIPMSLSGGIIYDEDDQSSEIATFGIFTDLRAIQKIEQDLQQTHKMLLQSEKMAGLGRLAAGVAHEINNPMAGIMLYSNLVKEQLGPDHAAQEDLDILIHEAERCKQIVSDLLEFSQPTSFERTGVDVNEQIHKTLAILHKGPLFQNIEIQLELEENLSRIWGNPVRLNQVFMNLVVNASQAMDGRGRLSISTRHRSNKGLIEIALADSGPGIEKDILGQIFDPFFTTKAGQGGTGLGLSVSYSIIRELNGTIRAESEEGKGAKFFLRFPVLQPEVTEIES